mgnify:CR=1 FL=1
MAGEGTAVTAGRLEGAKVYQGLGVEVSVIVGVLEACLSPAASRALSCVEVPARQLVNRSTATMQANQPRYRIGKVRVDFIAQCQARGLLTPLRILL